MWKNLDVTAWRRDHSFESFKVTAKIHDWKATHNISESAPKPPFKSNFSEKCHHTLKKHAMPFIYFHFACLNSAFSHRRKISEHDYSAMTTWKPFLKIPSMLSKVTCHRPHIIISAVSFCQTKWPLVLWK